MQLESVVDKVVSYLEEQIITGKIGIGERIKEEEIASLLKVSRPPIREALKVLEASDLIVKKPRIGAFVTAVKSEDVREIYTIKASLYELSLCIAMDRLDDHGIREVEETVREMERYANRKTPNIVKYQAAHKEFHGIAIELTDNRRLKKIVNDLDRQVKRLSFISLGDREHLISSCNYHRQIMDAIKARDKELAVKLTHEHIISALDKLIELIEPGESKVKVSLMRS